MKKREVSGSISNFFAPNVSATSTHLVTREDLENFKKKAEGMPLTLQHAHPLHSTDIKEHVVIGKIEKAWIDESTESLRISGTVNNDRRGDKAWNAIQNKFLTGFSCGIINDFDPESAKNNKELFEVSIVAVPEFGNATFTNVREIQAFSSQTVPPEIAAASAQLLSEIIAIPATGLTWKEAEPEKTNPPTDLSRLTQAQNKEQTKMASAPEPNSAQWQNQPPASWQQPQQQQTPPTQPPASWQQPPAQAPAQPQAQPPHQPPAQAQTQAQPPAQPPQFQAQAQPQAQPPAQQTQAPPAQTQAPPPGPAQPPAHFQQPWQSQPSWTAPPASAQWTPPPPQQQQTPPAQWQAQPPTSNWAGSSWNQPPQWNGSSWGQPAQQQQPPWSGSSWNQQPPQQQQWSAPTQQPPQQQWGPPPSQNWNQPPSQAQPAQPSSSMATEAPAESRKRSAQEASIDTRKKPTIQSVADKLSDLEKHVVPGMSLDSEVDTEELLLKHDSKMASIKSRTDECVELWKQYEAAKKQLEQLANDDSRLDEANEMAKKKNAIELEYNQKSHQLLLDSQREISSRYINSNKVPPERLQRQYSSWLGQGRVHPSHLEHSMTNLTLVSASSAVSQNSFHEVSKTLQELREEATVQRMKRENEEDMARVRLGHAFAKSSTASADFKANPDAYSQQTATIQAGRAAAAQQTAATERRDEENKSVYRGYDPNTLLPIGKAEHELSFVERSGVPLTLVDKNVPVHERGKALGYEPDFTFRQNMPVDHIRKLPHVPSDCHGLELHNMFSTGNRAFCDEISAVVHNKLPSLKVMDASFSSRPITNSTRPKVVHDGIEFYVLSS